MNLMRTLPILLFVMPTLFASAQGQLRITDPTAMVYRPNLAQDTAAVNALRRSRLNDATMASILRNSEPERWPAGLRTIATRTENRKAMTNYVVRPVCEVITNEGNLTLVSVLAAENRHMPEALRSNEDFHLLFRNSGLDAVPVYAARPKPSAGPRWRERKQMRIVKPDGVYATYDLMSDEEALAKLKEAGMDRSEIEAVIFRCHERNWPEGIDRFEKRYPKLKEFKKMVAYQAAQWDGKVLLIIPAEANNKLAPGLRPYLDIYMVYEEQSVAAAGK